MKIQNIKTLAACDPILEKLILALPEPSFTSTNNVFHDLISCVIEQQIHYRSSKKIFEKLLNAAQLEQVNPKNFHLFEEKSLKNTKLSSNKYETILHILHFWENNQLDWTKLSNEEVSQHLSSIKGIGKWTIDMILLYTLNRTNIFPYDDYHLKLIMSHLYQLKPKMPLKAQMMAIAAHWGEQKSLATLYLLAWKERNKK